MSEYVRLKKIYAAGIDFSNLSDEFKLFMTNVVHISKSVWKGNYEPPKRKLRTK